MAKAPQTGPITAPRVRRAPPALEQGIDAAQASGIAAGPSRAEPETAESESIFNDDAVIETRRPAAAPTASLVPQTEDEDGLLTRRSQSTDGDSRLDIPDEYKRPGWDYEFKTSRVNGADVDQSDTAQIYEGGWRPVLAASMPKLCTPGWTGKYITRLGQILYTRPMHLTMEAAKELYDKAEQQKYERLKAASDIQMPKSSMRSARPQIEIEGDFGSYRPKQTGT